MGYSTYPPQAKHYRTANRYNPSKNGAEMWPVHAGAPSSPPKLLVIMGNEAYPLPQPL
jgi:hypothetical protein